MSKKADITFSRGEGDKLVVTPVSFVLKKGLTQIRIRNDSGADIQLDLRDALAKKRDLRTAAGAEASPKIIAEASPKIIAERSTKAGVRA